MGSTRISIAVLAALTLLVACKSEPPTTVEGWADEIPEIKRDKELREAATEMRKAATEELRQKKDLSPAVPKLVALLAKNAVVRQEAAYILGEIGDPSAGPALVDAIDHSAAVADKDASRSNGKIAEALGKLKAKEGVKPLLKLTRSPDGFTALAAVKAVGEIGDSSAVEPLMELATSEVIDPFISRNAIEALGRIGDPKAMPALINMLFRERRGVSFYRESSFAIFQVGSDSIERLTEILDGKDTELLEWAKEKGVLEAALYAKTAQVLGDLSDRRATPALLRRLKYDSEYDDMRLLPRMFSAEALGRMRERKAVPVLAGMLEEEEANARGTYSRALVMIGDRAAVPAMAKASTSGMGYDAREETQWALAQLGGAGDLARFDAATKHNEKLATCTAWFQCEPGVDRKECMAEMEKECNKRIETYTKRLEKYRPMLVAAEACKTDVACWTGKLQDADARVREKAAWELGRSAKPEALDPLLSAAQEEDLKGRFAILHAIDSLLFDESGNPPAKATAQKVADRMNSILVDEAGKSHFIKINEDVKRLTLKVERALRNGA